MPVTFFCLPEELICHILMLVRWSPNSFRYHGQWLPTTQVNTQWRRIAIQYKPLWAAAICTFFTQKGTDCALQRAGLSPLVFVPMAYGRDREMKPIHYRLALLHLARIAVLRTTAYGDPGLQRTYSDTHPIHLFIRELGAASRPALTELAIRRYMDDDRAFEIDMELVAEALCEISLEGLLFRVRAPQLRVLTIRGSLPTWGWHRPSVPLGLVPIHAFLKAHPLLEDVLLGHVWQPLDSHPTVELISENIISLPHLRKLSLVGSRFKPDIMQLLDVPLGLELYIRDHGIHPPTLFGALQAHIAREGLNSVVYRDGHCTNTSNDSYRGDRGTIQLTSTETAHSNRPPVLTIDFQYYNFFGVEVINPDAIIKQIVAAVPNLCSLDMHDIGTSRGTYISTDALRERFVCMQNVTSLHISLDRLVNHALALCDAVAPGQAPWSATRIPLPSLDTLYVHGLVVKRLFREESIVGIGARQMAGLRVMWSPLIRMLKRRQRAGRSIRTLVLCAEQSIVECVDWHSWADEVKDMDYEMLTRVAGLVQEVVDMRTRSDFRQL